MKANLTEIAEHLNISKSTVSRALRNNPAISLKTRARVVEAAREFDYSVRHFRKGRKDSPASEGVHVAVLISGKRDITQNSLSYQMLNGVTDATHEAGGLNSVHFIDSAEDGKIEQAFSSIGNRYPRGLVLMGRFDEAIVKEFASKYPCVSLNYKYNLPNVDAVAPEDNDSIVFLVKRLFNMGHRRIGFVEVNSPHPGEGRRLGAYLSAMCQLGLDYSQADIIASKDKFPDTGSKVLQALKMTSKGVTAWVCGTDDLALKLLRAFEENGLSVPDDVSLTGFGAVFSSDISKELCTMRIPFEEIGSEGVVQLLERIKFPGRPSRHVLLECKFVEGTTVKAL